MPASVPLLPANPLPVCLKLFFSPVDYENNGLNGICVTNVDAHGHELGVVNDVRVTGFNNTGLPGGGHRLREREPAPRGPQRGSE
jgi:hypothetical protein